MLNRIVYKDFTTGEDMINGNLQQGWYVSGSAVLQGVVYSPSAFFPFQNPFPSLYPFSGRDFINTQTPQGWARRERRERQSVANKVP